MMNGKHFPIKHLLAQIDVQENVPLAYFSTLKVGGPARYLVMPNTLDQVAQIELAAFEHGISLHVLSGGSNTLFSDSGFDGIVLKLGKAFDFVKADDDGLHLTIGARTSFAKVTKMALMRGWKTALGWSGTPGLIGGAIRMNAGTRLGEIGDAVFLVHGIKNGQEFIYRKDEIEFAYRSSDLPSDLIICKAELSYDRHLVEPADALMAKVQEYRQKRRLTQPTINSLGSFFKNPYPLFAAQLIENCNLKGLQYNGAQISPLHANFIVNNGGASANDILYIAKTAQQRVFDAFGISLVPEIRAVGRFSCPKPLCTNKFPKH
jgi:UDP-N-acetylmuramate dehydrogenase